MYQRKVYCIADLNNGLLTHTSSLEDGYVLFDTLEGVDVYTDLKGSYAWNRSDWKAKDMNVYIEVLHNHMNNIYC